ncbi:uncharacterized protein LOC120666552 [Panicum virgatum]|uniref:Uncharacterized protein n=1 Tax=Panicum virgatum TaxID=38727 RepID=A0A8T0UHZ0_PANVG|nr:uncharacterized protein LOC120666552 [Panicum virgatum]KAG2621615.1 hypothetical protein PVAP13_3NG316332 [Panicum virgatum]
MRTLWDGAVAANAKRAEDIAKLQGLQAALGQVKEALERVPTSLDNLKIVARLVLDDLGMSAADYTTQLGAQLIQAVDGPHKVVQELLYLGAQRSFAIARSHYANIDLAELSQGFPSTYSEAELVGKMEEKIRGDK